MDFLVLKQTFENNTLARNDIKQFSHTVLKKQILTTAPNSKKTIPIIAVDLRLVFRSNILLKSIYEISISTKNTTTYAIFKIILSPPQICKPKFMKIRLPSGCYWYSYIVLYKKFGIFVTSYIM